MTRAVKAFAVATAVALLGSLLLVAGALAAPTPVMDPVTVFGAHSATFTGTVNPNGAPAGYQFEFSEDGGLDYDCIQDEDCFVSQDTPVGEGNAPVPATETATALEANTTYKVRLVAREPSGEEEVVSNEVEFTTLEDEPVVRPLLPAGQTSTAALLGALVNPENSSTSYYVEYSTSPAFSGSIKVPASEDADAGSGSSYVAVAQLVTGLTPATVYHYRVVATNGAGTTVGEARNFKTRAAAPPTPPTRGYERVSPPNRNGADIDGGIVGAKLSVTPQGAASDPSGENVSFQVHGVVPGSNSGTFGQYFAQRTPGGWDADLFSTTASPVFESFRTYTGRYTTADLEHYVFETRAAMTSDATPKALNFYVRETATGDLTLLNPGAVPGEDFRFYTASPDGSRVLLRSPDGTSLIESRDGALADIGQVPAGGTSCGGSAPACVPSAVGAYPGAGDFGLAGVLSEDGARTFFHTPAAVTNSPELIGPIFMREDDRSIEVSASQRTVPDPDGPYPPLFIAAEPTQGSAVLFASCEKLTDDSTAHNAQIGTSLEPECRNRIFGESASLGPDVYRYDVETEELTDMTSVGGPPADVLGVVGYSEDLRRLYFIAEGVLAPGAVAGENNLYLSDDGEITYIASVQRDEGGVSLPNAERPSGDLYLWEGEPHAVTRVSPDGNHLVFVSRARLSSYDNSGPGCTFGGCKQVYLYDAPDAGLTCVSCDPSGDPPTDNAVLAFAAVRTSRESLPVPRNLSPDGSSLFFNSPDALVPEDVNGTYDVYRWENGELELISPGTGPFKAKFADASVSGDDAFFITGQRLVGTDIDNLTDVYDAKVGGGFPEPPAPEPPCVGEGCQPAPSGPPAPDALGSIDQSGAGNFDPGTACKGQQKKVKQAQRALKAAAGSKAKQKQRTKLTRAKNRLQNCRGGGA